MTDQKNKKPSILSFLFTPRLGDDIRPLRDNARGFVHMIAMIFVAYRLFPKDHPALLGETDARLTMGEIFATAWRGLSFTREGMPQVVLFVAVLGAMVFTTLFILTAILGLLTGTAQAADAVEGGMFSLSGQAKACDLGTIWIDYMFFGTDINAAGCGTELPVSIASSSAIQEAVRGALAFYSNGVLVFAGIILFYHLVSMVVETAHTGKPMGRANQIWAPIRLVVAIGLLVPIGSSGLNSGQYIVIQTGKWSSAFASNTWRLMIDKISSKEGLGGMDLKMPPPKEISTTVKTIVDIKACQIAYNQMVGTMFKDDQEKLSEYLIPDGGTESEGLCGDGWEGGNTITVKNDSMIPGVDEYDLLVQIRKNLFPMCSYTHFSNEKEMFCGKIVFSPTPNEVANYVGKESGNPQVLAVAQKMYDANKDAIKALMTDKKLEEAAASINLFLEKAYQTAEYQSKTEEGKTRVELIKDSQKLVEDLITEYQKKVASGFANKGTVDLEPLKTTWSNRGWVMAGAWFNTIARAQGSLFSGVEAGLPSVEKGMPEQQHSMISNVWKKTKDAGRAAFNDTINRVTFGLSGDVLAEGEEKSINVKVLGIVNDFRQTVLKGAHSASESAAITAGLSSGESGTKISGVAALMAVVDGIGKIFNVWGEGDGLFLNVGSTANPFAELSYMGYTHLEFGLNLIVAGATASALSASFAGMGGAVTAVLTGGAGPAAASIFLFLGMIFCTTGVLITYMLPLIPFLKFFFNVLTWLLILLEAVVAAPLFALAHLSPYGDGLPGGAQKGYYFLLSIILRPVLHVIGLVVGIVLFFVAIHFLNISFAVAVAGSGVSSGTLAVASRIVFSVLYAAMAYICANTCFSTISFFIENNFNWLNAQHLAGKPMGDKGTTNHVVGVVTALGAKELATKAGGAGAKAGSLLAKKKPSEPKEDNGERDI